MPRLAGDTGTYVWQLVDKTTGKPSLAAPIELVSVTTVIGKVLAKEALYDWNYRETRDRIAGAIAVLHEEKLWTSERIVDLFSDADWIEEFFKSNRLRPRDTTRDSADAGRAHHDALESLAVSNINDGPDRSYHLAAQVLEDRDATGHRVATARWWLDRRPIVEATEEVVYSLEKGYAGTLDLAWMDRDGGMVITDLKNRKAGAESYSSDHFQLDAYDYARDEMYGISESTRTVLVARADGTYVEDKVILPPGAFLSLLEIYNDMQEALL